MRELRLEKKFVYNEGDNSYNFFIINSMLKQTYPKRKVNSIYFDTYNHRDVWENINGFGERKKIRVRWYDELNNSKVFIEIKKKINFVTQKEVEEINTFKNYNSLISFLDSEKLIFTQKEVTSFTNEVESIYQLNKFFNFYEEFKNTAQTSNSISILIASDWLANKPQLFGGG